LTAHKPFAVIADNLTKRGFFVLRVDDRGTAKTTGDFSQATSLDFAKDVEAGLDFLEAQPEVNKENIGLIGHSEGGLIAPIVANERKEVKFMVLLAGPGIPVPHPRSSTTEPIFKV
jgi:alpha/beta superfamily hydrolase